MLAKGQGNGLLGRCVEHRREQRRVAAHIQQAEERAALRPPSGLCREQWVARRLLLGELARYRAVGRFPQNPLFRQATPYFVDASGTRCAVAHLLELGGEGALVQRIARERNHARVAELVDEPRLVAWLRAAGLTLDEAAMIQPSYCGDHSACVCNGRAAGYLEAVVSVRGEAFGTATATIGAIHGEVDPGLAVGTEVQTTLLGDVDTGLVLRGTYDHELDDGTKVYAGVSFSNGLWGCDWGPALTRHQYLRAVLSGDCQGVIADLDEQDECGGCGCRAGGSGQPTSWGIALAVLGVVLARRSRRRRPRATIR